MIDRFGIEGFSQDEEFARRLHEKLRVPSEHCLNSGSVRREIITAHNAEMSIDRISDFSN